MGDAALGVWWEYGDDEEVGFGKGAGCGRCSEGRQCSGSRGHLAQ